MPKFPSKQGTDNAGGVRLPSNTDKAIMTRTEDLLNDIESAIAMSVGSVFFNQKATITNFAQLKAKANGQSLLISSLEDIKNSIDNLFDKNSKTYKDTYKLFKDSAIALNKLSDANFMSNLATKDVITDNIISYEDKFDSVIETLKGLNGDNDESKQPQTVEQLNNIIQHLDKLSEANSSTTQNEVKNTLDIVVSGVDNTSIEGLLELGKLELSENSILNSKTLKNFVNALNSINNIDVNSLSSNADPASIDNLKDYFNTLNEFITVQTTVANNLASIPNIELDNINVLSNDTIAKINELAELSDTTAIKLLNYYFTDLNELSTIIGGFVDNINKTVELDVSKLDDTEKFIKKIGKLSDNIDKDDIKELSDYFKELNELFALQNTVANNADKSTLANKKIQESLQQTDETVVKSGDAASNADKGVLNMSGVGKFIIACGFTMMIGALFMMIPGMVENSLKFGVTLGLFIAAVLLPIALMSKIVNPQTMNSIKDFKGFIFACGIVMLIGAAVMLIPGIVKNSLKFGATLGLFIAAVLLPIALMSKIANAETLKAIKDFKGFIVSCGLVMLIGAAVMLIPGIVKNSLKFGATLGLFIAAVLLPITLMSRIAKGDTMKAIGDIKGLVVTCAVIMMIGALFMMAPGVVKLSLLFGLTLGLFILTIIGPILLFSAICRQTLQGIGDIKKLIITCTILMFLGAAFIMLGGGKIVKAALTFGLILGAFIAVIILPIMIFSFLAWRADKTLKNLTRLIVTCTIVMLVGALFMMTGLWKPALLFGVVMMAFITLVLLPIMLFTFLGKRARKNLIGITALIIVCTVVMLVGVYFMKSGLWKEAIAFGVLLAAFIAIVLLPFVLYTKILRSSTKGALALSLIIAISAATLIFGAWAMKKFGAWNVMLFAIILAAFTAVMGLTYKMIASTMTKTMHAAASFAIIVSISAATLIFGAWAMKKFGGWNIVGFAAILAVFTGIMGAIFVGLGVFENEIEKGTEAIIGISIGLGLLTAVVLLMVGIGKYAGGFENLLIYIGILSGFVGLMGLMFGIAGKFAEQIFSGSIAITAMGVGLLALSGAILLFVKIGKLAGSWTELLAATGIMLGVIIAFGLIFSALSMAIVPITLGSIAAAAMGVGLASISGAVLLFMMAGKIGGGWLALAADVLVLGVFISSMVGVFAIAGLAMPLIVIGSLAIASMSAGIIGISVGVMAFAAVEKICGGWSKLLGDVAIISAFITAMVAVFGIAGLASPIILLGTAAILLISTGLLALSLVITLFTTALAISGGGKKLVTKTADLSKFILKCAVLFGSAVLAAIPAGLAILALPIIGLAVTGISAVILSMSLANAAFKLAGPFDAEGIKTSISDFIGITDVCPGPIEFLKTMAKLASLGVLTTQIKFVVGQICDAISEYADLKIATKWDNNGNPIKFRQLSTDDFKTAAEGVKLVITTLAGAIKDTWEQNTWLQGDNFRDILNRMVSLSITEGIMLSKLSGSLQNYANLLIPTKWDKEGNAIKFRSMKDTDFTTAAEGVKKVMVTLAGAITDTYNSYPELFGSDAEEIIENAKALALAEGEMLSSLAQGLQQYAKLAMPSKWNKKGEPIDMKPMETKDFEKAAYNIGTVMTTMAQSVISAWNGGSFSIVVNGQQKIINGGVGLKKLGDPDDVKEIMEALQPIGELISSTAEGIQNYALLKVATKWDRKGKPIKFDVITDEVFENASKNIGKVLRTVASAAKDAWDSMDGGFFGDDPEDILNGLKPIGELISSTAEGIQTYAALKVATGWDRKGKPTGFVKLEENDFIQAAENIGKVLRTTSVALSHAWTEITGIIGDDDFEDILENFTKVSTIIGTTAEGLESYASLKIPVRWNSNGKPVDYKTMNDGAFDAAGTNIVKVLMGVLFGNADVSTGVINKDSITGGLVGAYQLLQKLDLEDELEEISAAFVPIGELISSTAEAVKNYADLMVPIQWDDKGKAIGFKHLGERDFNEAGKSIETILTVIGNAIISFRNNPANKDYFDDGEDSIFAQTVASLATMGTLIKNIAEGINTYASGMIPVAWDKDGKPIDFKTIGEKEYNEAATNIGTLLNALGGAILSFRNNPDNAKYFDDGEDSIFAQTLAAVSGVGQLVKDIAEGVTVYAKGGIPRYNKDGKIIGYDKWPDNYFEQAGTNIQKIIECVGNSVIALYPEIEAKFGDSGEFKNVIEAVGKIGGAVKSIAEGVQSYANLRIPTKWDKDGKPTDFKPMKPTDFENASENIKNLIRLIGNAIYNAYSNDSEDKKQKSIKSIIEADFIDTLSENIAKMVGIIDNTGKMITNIAGLKIPNGFDKDGKATGYSKLDKTNIKLAADNIADVLVTIPSAIYDAYTTHANLFAGADKNKDPKYIEALQDSLPNIIDVVKTVKNLVKAIVDNSSKFNELFKYKSKYKGKLDTSETINIDIYKDLYGIIYETGLISSLLSTFVSKSSNLVSATVADNVSSSLDNIRYILDDIVSFAKLFTKNDKELDKLTNDTVVKSIQHAVSNINEIATSIVSLVEPVSTSIILKLNNDLIESIISDSLDRLYNITNSVIITIDNIVSSYKTVELLLKSNNLSKIKDDIIDSISFVSKLSAALSYNLTNNFTEVIKLLKNTDIFADFNNAVKSINTSIITICRSIQSIYDAYNTAAPSIMKLTTVNLFKGNDGIITSIVNDMNLFLNNVSDNIDSEANIDIINQLSAFINEFNKFITSDTGLVTAITTITKAVDSLDDIIQEPIDEKSCGYICDKLKPIMNDINNTVKVLSILENSIDDNSIPYIIEATGNSLTVLGDGIVKVLSAIASSKENKTFATNTEQLNKFINNSINTIDIERIDRLTSLILALNSLADKTTNLDELTNAIANNLTDVLNVLAQKMDEAKGAFETIDTIQERRHDLINKSISNIKEIMRQQIEVHVTAEMPGGDNLSTPESGTDNSSNDSTGSSISTGGSSSSGTSTPTTSTRSSGSSSSGSSSSGGYNTSNGTLEQIRKLVERIANRK